MQDGQDGPRVASRYACKVDFRVKRASPQATLELQDTPRHFLVCRNGNRRQRHAPRKRAMRENGASNLHAILYVYDPKTVFAANCKKKRGYLYLLRTFFGERCKDALAKKRGIRCSTGYNSPPHLFFLLLLLKVACVRA